MPVGIYVGDARVPEVIIKKATRGSLFAQVGRLPTTVAEVASVDPSCIFCVTFLDFAADTSAVMRMDLKIWPT